MATDDTNAKLVDIANTLATQENADMTGRINDKGKYLRDFRTYLKHLQVSAQHSVNDTIDRTEAELAKLHPPKG